MYVSDKYDSCWTVVAGVYTVQIALHRFVPFSLCDNQHEHGIWLMPAAAAILEVESFCYRNLGHINRVEQHAQPGFHSIVFSTAAANGISMRVMNELEWTAATSDAQFARRRVQACSAR